MDSRLGVRYFFSAHECQICSGLLNPAERVAEQYRVSVVYVIKNCVAQFASRCARKAAEKQPDQIYHSSTVRDPARINARLHACQKPLNCSQNYPHNPSLFKRFNNIIIFARISPLPRGAPSTLRKQFYYTCIVQCT